MPSPARMRHIPALDGLRGAAVLAVLAFHGGHFTGGYLGVDLFFVLSGFLITSLLLAESGSTGRVSLARFWERRARRLLPALLVMLVGVAAYARLVAKPEELHRIRMDGLATIFYAANWRSVFSHYDYWSLFSAPSPFDHTWSLAIEEQFYVIWPLLFAGLLLLRRRSRSRAAIAEGATDGDHGLAMWVLGVAVVLGAISAALSLELFRTSGSNRVYYGTDTRALAILAGVALAALQHRFGPVQSRLQRAALEVVGLAGVVVLGLAWTRLDGNGARLYHGGLIACSLAATAVIAAATHPRRGPIAIVASWKPLTWAGLISYGIYLYHWPIFVWLNADRVHLDGWALFAVQCGVTLAAAVVSYFVVEQPIRHGSGWRPRTKILVPSASLASVGIIIVVATLGYRPPPKLPDAQRAINAAVTASKRNHTRRVMVVGNSVAFFLGKDGFVPIEGSMHATVLNLSVPACTWPDIMRVQLPEGGNTTSGSKRCTTFWRTALAQFKPDLVIFTRNGVSWAPMSTSADGPFYTPCTPAWTTWWRHSLEQMVAEFSAAGAKTVLITSATSEKHVFIDNYAGTVAATKCGNALEHAVAATTPRVQLLDLAAWLQCDAKGVCLKERNGVLLRQDGTHYKGAGAVVVAQWAAARLRY